jgi:hypothetical protein
MKDVKFSWRNYFRPTPDNLQYISVSMRSIIGSIAGTTLIMEANKWITFGILLSGFILDELIKFFGHVKDDAKRVISVEVDSKAEVEVKDEIKEPEV